jgi:hypothetical protein
LLKVSIIGSAPGNAWLVPAASGIGVLLEILDLLFCLCLWDAVDILQPAEESLSLSFEAIDFLRRKPRPSFAQPRLEMVPVPFDSLPAHRPPLSPSSAITWGAGPCRPLVPRLLPGSGKRGSAAAAQSEDQGHQEQNKKQEEQNLRDRRGARGNASEPKDGRDDSDYEKYKRPVQHE